MKTKITMTGRRLTMLLIVLLPTLTSCEDDFERQLPLAVDQHALTLDAAAGSTHVLVHATDSWEASFAADTPWAVLRKRAGEFLFEYGDNPGIGRMTEIVIRSRGLEKRIVVTQHGAVANPEILLTEQRLELPASGGEAFVPFETNLGEALDRIAAKAICLDAAGEEVADAAPWIAEIRIAADAVGFTVAANTTGADRKLRLTLEVDDAVNETVYTTSTDLTQIAAE